MSHITKEQLKTLKRLCRIRLSDEEEEVLLNKLQNVLGHIKKLDEVNTDNVAPCNHVIQGMQAPLREDIAIQQLSRADFLKASPDHVGGMIKVPPILKDEL